MVESSVYSRTIKAERELKESENIGLNPLDDEQGDIKLNVMRKSPIYLAHILEHDYLIKGENGKVSLGGVVIGLALNSVSLLSKGSIWSNISNENSP